MNVSPCMNVYICMFVCGLECVQIYIYVEYMFVSVCMYALGMYMGVYVCKCVCVCVYMCGAYAWICVCESIGVYVCEYVCVWGTSVYKNVYEDLYEYVCVLLLPLGTRRGAPEEGKLWEMARHICGWTPNQGPQPTLRSSSMQGKFHPHWVQGWPV